MAFSEHTRDDCVLVSRDNGEHYLLAERVDRRLVDCFKQTACSRLRRVPVRKWKTLRFIWRESLDVLQQALIILLWMCGSRLW